MAQDNTPVAYRIKFEKDRASVRVTYDLSVPMDGPALIAGFQASVEGADLIGNFIPGQSRFNGAQFHTLSRPDQGRCRLLFHFFQRGLDGEWL